MAYIAARDRRVKAVASMVLVGDGVRRMRRFRTEEQWQTLMQKVQEDRINRALNGKSKDFHGFFEGGNRFGTDHASRFDLFLEGG